MMLTGNVIAILIAVTSGALDTYVKVRSAEFGKPQVQSRLPTNFESTASISAPETFSAHREFQVGQGFLFIDGKYCAPSSVLRWSAGLLKIDDPNSSMLAAGNVNRRATDTMSDAFMPPEIPDNPEFEVSESEFGAIQYALQSGGVVNMSSVGKPYSAGLSEGGIEMLEAINTPKGAQRERLIDEAFDRGSEPSVETRAWLSSYTPENELVGRIGNVLNRVNAIQESNTVAATAMRRFNNWSYPLTITAMMIFVLSMGSLLAARPQELVAVAHTETDVSVNRFLWLIGGMSVIDLVWTLLAHQANQIAEVNPVGNILLGDAQRTILFKALATGLAIGILYKARHSLFARKACWWVCLTLALLMARWVLVSGVST